MPELLVAIGSVIVLVGVGALGHAASRSGVWGAERVRHAAGAGAYRAGAVTTERPRPVPPSVVLATGAAWAWGAFSVLVCVPIGIVATLAALEMRATFVEIVGVALTVSAAGVALALFATGARLAADGERASAHARRTAGLLLVHQVATVAIPATVVGIAQPAALIFALVILAVPLIGGAVVARLLHVAARDVDAL